MAKFSSTTDIRPVVRQEATSLALARYAGITVPASEVIRSMDKDVLLVQRFDRPDGGARRMMVSGLTILQLDEMMARYATYPDLVDRLQDLSAQPQLVGPEIFERIAFNIAVSNTDDHARNHAAFWDGRVLELTPAYDLDPQFRRGETASQAMAYGDEGERASNFALLLKSAGRHVEGTDPESRIPVRLLMPASPAAGASWAPDSKEPPHVEAMRGFSGSDRRRSGDLTSKGSLYRGILRDGIGFGRS